MSDGCRQAAVSPSGVTARDNAGSSLEGPISKCCGRVLCSKAFLFWPGALGASGG